MPEYLTGDVDEHPVVAMMEVRINARDSFFVRQTINLLQLLFIKNKLYGIVNVVYADSVKKMFRPVSVAFT